MKLLLAMTLWLWAAAQAWTVTTLEQSFICPIDGEAWRQRIETSTRPTGLRLDLKKLGDVIEPPTLPQCPKCRFVVFSDRLSEPVLKKLKALVLGGDYQMLAAKSPSWACLAHIQQFIHSVGLSRNPKNSTMQIGFSYLRASWQVEEKPALCERYLSRAYDHFTKAAETIPAGHKDRLNLLLLCGELERRLGKFDAAEQRFRELLDSEEFKDEPRREPIVALQLELIGAKDSAPHALGRMDKPAPAIPLGIAPAAPSLGEESPAAAAPAGNVLDLNQPLTLEAAPQAPFPAR